MADGGSAQDIQQRVKPILDKVAVEGLRGMAESHRPSRCAVQSFHHRTHAKLIVKKQLTEDALEAGLIGFE